MEKEFYDLAEEQNVTVQLDSILVEDAMAALGGDFGSAYTFFLRTLPYSFYPWLTLLMVYLVAATGRDFGPMHAAERRALAAAGQTVAVLGTGVDRCYPAAHRRLFADIMANGLVVSELPPGAPPLKHHFPARNRILAGLGDAVLVVQAPEKSGALITVDHALDLGREIFAVPGSVEIKGGGGPVHLEGVTYCMGTTHIHQTDPYDAVYFAGTEIADYIHNCEWFRQEYKPYPYINGLSDSTSDAPAHFAANSFASPADSPASGGNSRCTRAPSVQLKAGQESSETVMNERGCRVRRTGNT